MLLWFICVRSNNKSRIVFISRYTLNVNRIYIEYKSTCLSVPLNKQMTSVTGGLKEENIFQNLIFNFWEWTLDGITFAIIYIYYIQLKTLNGRRHRIFLSTSSNQTTHTGHMPICPPISKVNLTLTQGLHLIQNVTVLKC